MVAVVFTAVVVTAVVVAAVVVTAIATAVAAVVSYSSGPASSFPCWRIASVTVTLPSSKKALIIQRTLKSTTRTMGIRATSCMPRIAWMTSLM